MIFGPMKEALNAMLAAEGPDFAVLRLRVDRPAPAKK
jgi:hypothetical protein